MDQAVLEYHGQQHSRSMRLLMSRIMNEADCTVHNTAMLLDQATMHAVSESVRYVDISRGPDSHID